MVLPSPGGAWQPPSPERLVGHRRFGPRRPASPPTPTPDPGDLQTHWPTNRRPDRPADPLARRRFPPAPAGPTRRPARPPDPPTGRGSAVEAGPALELALRIAPVVGRVGAAQLPFGRRAALPGL